MNKKSMLALVSILALALVFTSSNRKVDAALTLIVDDDSACPGATFTSIQAAVNAAAPGDTIQVCAGTYNESVNIPASLAGLTLNGAQAGIAVSGRVFGSLVESTVNGQITVRPVGVTIDGFSLTRSVPSFAAFGIVVAPGADDATITNTIIDTVFTPDTSGNGTAQAIYLENSTSVGPDGPDNVSILNNRINNVQSNRSAKGVLIGVNNGTNPSQNALIQNNTITNITSDTRGAYGVSVANTLGVSGLQVLDNTFTNLVGTVGWAHAVGLEGDTPGALVTGNAFTNVTDGNPTPVADAAAVFLEANPSLSTVEVHNNQFNVTIASFGIAVHPALSAAFPAAMVDGECNWWGSADGPGPVGPGSGARVSPNVDYAPWQIAPNGACIGGNVPTTASECKNGGWMTRVRADGSTFKNQGDCIQYVNTGK